MSDLTQACWVVKVHWHAAAQTATHPPLPAQDYPPPAVQARLAAMPPQALGAGALWSRWVGLPKPSLHYLSPVCACCPAPASTAHQPSCNRHASCPQVLDQVGDSEAIYSPLARGASVLSDRGYLEEGAGTPRSTAAAWPMVSDEAGTPCSPWWVSWFWVLQWLLWSAVVEVRWRVLLSAGIFQQAAIASPAYRLVTHNNVLFAAPQSLNGSPLAAGDASSPTRRSHAVRSVQFGDSWGGGDAVPAQRVGRRPSFTSYTNGAPSPGSRRVPRAAEEIQPAAESEAIHVWDSRDQDTGEASPVRPAVRRMPRQQGCILSHLS